MIGPPPAASDGPSLAERVNASVAVPEFGPVAGGQQRAFHPHGRAVGGHPGTDRWGDGRTRGARKHRRRRGGTCLSPRIRRDGVLCVRVRHLLEVVQQRELGVRVQRLGVRSPLWLRLRVAAAARLHVVCGSGVRQHRGYRAVAARLARSARRVGGARRGGVGGDDGARLRLDWFLLAGHLRVRGDRDRPGRDRRGRGRRQGRLPASRALDRAVSDARDRVQRARPRRRQRVRRVLRV